MGQCVSFFNRHGDVTGDGKFDWRDVKEIGSAVFGFLKKTAILLQMYAPVLEAAGVDTAEYNALLKEFNSALDLSAAVVVQLEALQIPKSLADFGKTGDVNHDGKRDINDMIAYVGMTEATFQKALSLADDAGKVQLNASITKLQAVAVQLEVIKKAQDDAALTAIAATM